ncbi:MAG: TlpA disulfide reductase family protein [Mariprofundaceae bacterium]
MSYWKAKLGIVLALLLFSAPASFAAEYEWKDASGTVKSLADYKGESVVLHFWASWCPPCRTEMPEMEAWSREHPDVKMIIVSLDNNIANAQAFLDSKGIAFPALKGDMGRAQRLGVRGLPTTLVIGSESDIIKTRVGSLNWADQAASDEILQALKSDS